MEVVHNMSGILSIMEDIRKTTENIFLNCIYHNTKIKQAGQDRLPSVSHILRTKNAMETIYHNVNKTFKSKYVRHSYNTLISDD